MLGTHPTQRPPPPPPPPPSSPSSSPPSPLPSLSPLPPPPPPLPLPPPSLALRPFSTGGGGGGLEGEEIDVDKFGSPPFDHIFPSILWMLCTKLWAPDALSHSVSSVVQAAHPHSLHDRSSEAAMCQDAHTNHPEPTKQ